MSLLGIDIGMTGCKSAAFGIDGRQLAAAYREYPMLHPHSGWAELDSRRVWGCVQEVIGEVAAKSGQDPITALCVSAMGEAMTPVSSDRTILGNCIVCSDTRGEACIEELKARIGQEDFYRINPNILSTAYSLPKLLWLREHDPELYRRAHKFLLWGDLVGFLLGCEPITSTSLANRTLLFDIHKEDWSDQLLALTGVERTKLPAILPGGAVAGTVSDAMAARLGLPRGVRVVVGGHDQCCASLGAGVTRAGRAVCGMGTVQCITPTFDHIPDARSMLCHGLSVEHHVLRGLYVSFIFNQAGSLVRWFRDTFASADARLVGEGDIYAALNAEIPGDPSRLIVLPHFEATGPPGYIHNSAGVVVGLRMDTTRGEILKAIMEGAAYYFLDSIESLRSIGIDTSEFIATGGAARSDAWLQIQADIFGIPFVRPTVTESGLVGTAILAGMGTGVFAGADEASGRFVRRERTFEPRERHHRRYRELYERYREIYPRLKEVLAEM